MWNCGRVFDANQKDLENLTVHVAENSLKKKHKKFEQFEDREDSEIYFLAWFLRRSSRDIDRKDYIVTYRQLDSILRKNGFFVCKS